MPGSSTFCTRQPTWRQIFEPAVPSTLATPAVLLHRLRPAPPRPNDILLEVPSPSPPAASQSPLVGQSSGGCQWSAAVMPLILYFCEGGPPPRPICLQIQHLICVILSSSRHGKRSSKRTNIAVYLPMASKPMVCNALLRCKAPGDPCVPHQLTLPQKLPQ